MGFTRYNLLQAHTDNPSWIFFIKLKGIVIIYVIFILNLEVKGIRNP